MKSYFENNRLIIVSALGYFVDVYDLLLFGVVKSSSLTAIGIKTDQLNTGIQLQNFQVLGLIVGGYLAGKYADKKSRLTVLIFSIGIYSAANIANAFVTNLPLYELCRFIAGVGLAGELGAGITLVKEEDENNKMNYGPQIITGFGLLGAVLAGVLGQLIDWRMTYLVGGLMGISLLFLRVGLKNSTMHDLAKKEPLARGNFRDFFNNWDRFKRYSLSILIGLPVYFVIALLIQSAKELGSQTGLAVNSGMATIVCYITFAAADFGFTYLSNLIGSRKKIFIGLHLGSLPMLLFFIYFPAHTAFIFYLKYALFGIFIGYWGLLTVNASEQFATRIRALASITVPNFIRGSFFFIGLAFTMLKGSLGLNMTILSVGIGLIAIALMASLAMKDGFNNSLSTFKN
jgi:putative MFS transporter